MSSLYDSLFTFDSAHAKVYTGHIWGINYTASSTYFVDFIKVRGHRDGSFGSVTAYLYGTDEDSLPVGSPLASSAAIPDEDIPAEVSEITFTFGNSYMVQEGTKYSLVFVAPGGDPDNSFHLIVEFLPQGSNYDLVRNFGEGWERYETYGGWFEVWGSLPPGATNPDPADGEENVGPFYWDIDDDMAGNPLRLDWSPGEYNDSYNVYMGLSPETLVYIGGESYSHLYVPDDIFLEPLTTYYWRVDSVEDGEVITGDVWSFTTADHTVPELQSPEDASENHYLNTDHLLQLSATDSDEIDLDNYTFYLSDGGDFVPQLDRSRYSIIQIAMYLGVTLDYSTEYSWFVRKQWGPDPNTDYYDSEIWTFSTIDYLPPVPSWRLLPGGTGGPGEGTEGVDWVYTGENNVFPKKRLVVAAENRIYYEDL